MMKISDFTEEMKGEIINAAKRSLMMIGVTADVHLLSNVIRGREYLRLKTDDFNTTPVIYKNVCIEGSAELIKVDGIKGGYDLYFYLDYRFETFSGGYNGTPLGVFHIRVFEREFEPIRFIGFIIR